MTIDKVVVGLCVRAIVEGPSIWSQIFVGSSGSLNKAGELTYISE